MAVLQVVEGSVPGQVLELVDERTLMVRHTSCQIVLDNVVVSRHHAQILESHGSYFLEDLRSRNGTVLNDCPVEGRHELHEGDRVRICDLLFRFYQHAPPVAASTPGRRSPRATDETREQPQLDNSGSRLLTVGDSPEDDHSDLFSDAIADSDAEALGERSSIISTLSASDPSSEIRLAVKPEVKLRAILEISRALGNVLRMEKVLPNLLDSLFKVFAQAEYGFVMLKDKERNKLVVKSTKSRHVGDERSVPVSTTIIKQALHTGQAILSADAIEDQRFKASESISNLKIRSMMCVPLIGKSGQALGVIQLDTKDIRDHFSQEDLEVIVSIASLAAMAVENAELHEEVMRQRDLERDLEFATQVQLGFLPNERPKVTGYEFADYYEAALSVGGDYFDYIALPDGKIGIALGDVAGKGVPAALLMARLYSSARYQMLTQSSPSAAMSGLNSELASCGLGYRFITLVMAVLEPESHRLTLANAGHLPPLVRKADGTLSAVTESETGLPLGISPEHVYHDTVLELQPDEVVLMYTDGVTEAMNGEREIFHRRRLEGSLAHAPGRVEQVIRTVVSDVEEFAEGHAQRDDLCMVGLRRIPEGEELTGVDLAANTSKQIPVVKAKSGRTANPSGKTRPNKK